MTRIDFYIDGDDDFSVSIRAPGLAVPRSGDPIRLTTEDGSRRVDGTVGIVSWGQEMTQRDGRTWVPVGGVIVASVQIIPDTEDR